MIPGDELGEARRLAALLAAYGDTGLRRRMREALELPMADADRVAMLRYDFSETLDSPKIPAGLRLRVEKFLVPGDRK